MPSGKEADEKEKGVSEVALRADRKNCYRHRDLYFACVDRQPGGDERRCAREYEAFAGACPASWLDHFMRKYKLEKYKQVVGVRQDGTIEFADGTKKASGEERISQTPIQLSESEAPVIQRRTNGGVSSASAASNHIDNTPFDEMDEENTNELGIKGDAGATASLEEKVHQYWVQKRQRRDRHQELGLLYAEGPGAVGRGLELIAELIQHGQLGPKMVVDAAKMVAMAHACSEDGSGVGGPSGFPSATVRAHTISHLRSVPDSAPASLYEFLGATVALLMDACENRWDRMGPLVEKAVGKPECFHLMAGIELARGRVDIIEDLCRLLPKVSFSLHPNLPFWTRFLRAIDRLNGATGSGSLDPDNLMNIYMRQLIGLRRPLDTAEMAHLKIALRAHGRWSCVPARVDYRTMGCSVCGAKVSPEELDPTEFGLLRSIFAKKIYMGALRMQSATKAGVMVLIRKLELMQEDIEADKAKSQSRRPLVVDLLNLVGGAPTADKLSFVHWIIGALQRDGFWPVLVVCKGFLNADYQRRLTGLGGVHTLVLGNHQKWGAHDDLFFLNATLQLGPSTYLLSNDKFRDFCDRWQVDNQEAFDRWIRSRTIGFRSPFPPDKAQPQYMLPNIWHCQGDPSTGYHILQEEAFKQRVYCVAPDSNSHPS